MKLESEAKQKYEEENRMLELKLAQLEEEEKNLDQMDNTEKEFFQRKSHFTRKLLANSYEDSFLNFDSVISGGNNNNNGIFNVYLFILLLFQSILQVTFYVKTSENLL
jgi:hypothetical protein